MSTTASVCVIGAINLDLVSRVAALPKPGETVIAAGLARHPGGKGLNQAVAAVRAGAATRMIGCVGRDEPGDWLTAFLGGEGVDAAQVSRDADAPTGQAFITVADDAENCIVVIAGANARLPAIIAPGEALTGVRVLLAQLETALEPVAALFAAEAPGCIKVLNAAPALPRGAELFRHCDVLVVNETELAAYANVASTVSPAEAVAAARRLITRPGQAVVVTLGAEGALVVEAGGDRHVPGRPAKAVDTVGAGDCFCGVLAAGLADGMALDAAVERANLAASIAVTRPGVAAAMPTRAEIEAAAGAR